MHRRQLCEYNDAVHIVRLLRQMFTTVRVQAKSALGLARDVEALRDRMEEQDRRMATEGLQLRGEMNDLEKRINQRVRTPAPCAKCAAVVALSHSLPQQLSVVEIDVRRLRRESQQVWDAGPWVQGGVLLCH